MTTKTTYAICMTREYYGPKSKKSRWIDPETGEEYRGTRAEALEKIRMLDNAVYYTAHNEVTRASYTIVRA